LTVIRAIRERRLYNIRQQILDNRLEHLGRIVKKIQERRKYSNIQPLEVALRIQGVYEFIDPDVSEFDSREFQAYLDAAVEEYTEKRNSGIRDGIAKAIREKLDLPASSDLHSLAIGTWIRCSGCNQTHTIDSFLVHPCYTLDIDIPKRQEMSDEYFEHVQRKFISSVWDSQSIDLFLDRQEEVIDVCGLDFKTATMEDLDRADTRLICTGHAGRYNPVMSWRTAV
jgi:hypothetical protein